MVKSKKILACLATAAIVASIAPVYGGTAMKVSAASKPVTLKYLEFNASGGQENTLKSLISHFEKVNPGIKVSVNIVSASTYYTKLNTQLSAGVDAPDVFEVGYENFAQYASKGQLRDMTKTIAKDKSFKKASLYKLAYNAYNYNGKQYGLCTDYSTVVMYYNKDLFRKNNVAYPTDSWKWSNELAAAKKITDASQGIWGIVQPLQAYEFYKVAAQNGGSFWSSNGKTSAINSSKNVAALQWMLDKSYKYKVQPPFTSDIYTQTSADLSAFESGKVGMFMVGTWEIGDFTKNCKFHWDIALEPGNTQHANHFFSNATVAYKNTKHPDAAWKFMKYMSTDQYAVKTRIAKGWSIPVVTSKSVMDAYYRKTPPASKKIISETLNNLVLPPLGPIPAKWSQVQKIVNDDLQRAEFQQMTAKQALSDAKEKIGQLLQ